MTSEQIISTHLIPAFGHHQLRSITREQMQDFLDEKAQTLSRSVVGHARWFLNAIFKLAQGDGVVDRNPASELRIPRQCKPGRQLRPLTGEESDLYLSVLEPRELVFARLLIYEGLRPGEALAFRWAHVFEAELRLRVEQRVYRGNFDTPKNNKERDCGISPGTAAALAEVSHGANEKAGICRRTKKIARRSVYTTESTDRRHGAENLRQGFAGRVDLFDLYAHARPSLAAGHID